MDSEESLEQLVLLWVVQKPFASLFDSAFLASHPAQIPHSLMNTITNKEPYRSQVVADAKIFLRIPVLHGIGMNIEIRTPIHTIPFRDWQQTICPLKAVIRWSRTMSGDNSEYQDIEIHRVVLEDDQWKIARIWDDKGRKQTMEDIEMIREAIKKRISKNDS